MDDATKDTHIGDLYIVNADGGDNAGFYYRFEKTASGYQWTLLKDNEITKALQDAKEANEKAQAVEDDLKENYSTTTEMNSAIEQTANSINLVVEERIYETEQFANSAAVEAEKNARLHADEIARLAADDVYYYASAKIDQTAETINLEVSKKVGNDEIISRINQSAEKITIQAEKIDLEGLVSATELISKFATIDSLNAQKARIDTISANYISAGTVSANYATISSLNSVSARVDSLEANFMSADTIHANYMSVSTWTSGGLIKASRIQTDSLQVGAANVTGATSVAVVSTVGYTPITYKDGNGNNKSINVVTSVGTRTIAVLSAN